MVIRLGEEMGCSPTVVMTGGYASVMRRYLKCPVIVVDEQLVFKGMCLLINSISP
jgi:pantothenate kinase type III